MLGASAGNSIGTNSAGIGTERSVNRWFLAAWPIQAGATS